jgi:hypothetical protein
MNMKKKKNKTFKHAKILGWNGVCVSSMNGVCGSSMKCYYVMG